jgi:uncharacterized phage protein (TIGR02218 family)
VVKPLTPETASRFADSGAMLVHALWLRRRDGAVLTLTDHDRDVSFAGETFRADPGMTLLAFERTADLAPDHASVETAGSIGFSDVQNGLWSGARAELWKLDAGSPAARLLLLVGTAGQIEREGERVNIELRSSAEILAASTGRLYRRSCSARLGDTRCGIDLDVPGSRAACQVLHSYDLTVELATDAISARALANGRLGFTSGQLAGTERAIKTARLSGEGRTLVTLWEALPASPTVGDAAVLTIGCDKSFAVCRSRFANAVNFRGFPHIPGLDVLSVKRSGGL